VSNECRRGGQKPEAAVRKLEVAAVERQKACAYCRYKREAWPLPKGRPVKPEEVITKRCEFCRAKLTIGLPVELQLHSYIVRESFPHTCERRYTDKSVHAFSIWSSSMMAIFTIQLALSRNGDKPRKPWRNFARENLEREYNRLLMCRHKRLRARYGEPVPEHRETVNSVVNRERRRLSPYLHLEAFKGLYDQETHYLICAEMEKVFRGKVRPEMESEMAELRRQIDYAIATPPLRTFARSGRARLSPSTGVSPFTTARRCGKAGRTQNGKRPDVLRKSKSPRMERAASVMMKARMYHGASLLRHTRQRSHMRPTGL
jgi:hypothetical protein